MADWANAYVAPADKLPGSPDRDTALIWDGCLRWVLAVETHSGEDLLVQAYLGGQLLPEPGMVVGFAKQVSAEGPCAAVARPGSTLRKGPVSIAPAAAPALRASRTT